MPNRAFLPLLPIALIGIGGCNRHPKDAVYADRAWVRLAAVPGQPAAAYMTIHGGAQPAELVAVETKGAGSSELHETLNRSGPDGGPPQVSMDRVDAIDVPPAATVTLVPEDNHVMLFGVSPSVKPGTKLPLTLKFAKGPPVAVDAKVIAAGDAPPY